MWDNRDTMSKTGKDDLLLPSAAGRLLGVSSAAIRNWIYAGKLPALRLSGGVRVIRREDLERVAAQRASRGPGNKAA